VGGALLKRQSRAALSQEAIAEPATEVKA